MAILNLRFILPLSANLKSIELEKINNMGYFVGLPLGGAAEKDCQVRFGKNMTYQLETRAPHLPAEWALQSGIQLTWPHAGTDWTYMLDEVQECFVAIAHEIAARETLLIVTPFNVSTSCINCFNFTLIPAIFQYHFVNFLKIKVFL